MDVICLDCGSASAFHPLNTSCPACGSEWLQARYPLGELPRLWQEHLQERPFDLWRYHELLPLQTSPPPTSAGEGGTPLFHARNLGAMLGLNNLYIKDERQNPTSSFKDRQAVVSAAVLLEFGLNEAVVCSTGNVAIAFSAACARAGIRLWAFLTSRVPATKMHEVAIYGTQVIKIAGTYDEAKRLALDFAANRGVYFDRGARSIPALEAMKTIAFEVAEQLTAVESVSGGPRAWLAPDWYLQAVSGGLGPLGVLKGFRELHDAGLTAKIPKIAILQAEGCAPMVQAWEKGNPQAAPVAQPQTRISTLSTGDPGRTYTLLYEAMRANGGEAASVSDEEAYQALQTASRMEGLSVEPAAAVAFAGLFKLAQRGLFGADDVIVLNCSGHTMPVEKRLLDEGWSHEVDLADPASTALYEEGLYAALHHLDRRRTRTILVVDDQEDARRLIHRMLAAQGDYEIIEAQSAAAALESCREKRPDLIVLDLMMPDMDGFALLDRIRSVRPLQRIPVVVVTAKELSRSERDRLQGRISRLLRKGDLVDDDLIDEIEQALDSS